MKSSFSLDDDVDIQIDLTPLIDTVFLLLIFFIMAASFSKPVLDVVLQEAKGAVVQEKQSDPLTVTITKEGRILFGEQEVAPDEIDAFITTRPKEEALIFQVDKEAPFGLFVTALDAAKKNGKENFAIITAPHDPQ